MMNKNVRMRMRGCENVDDVGDENGIESMRREGR